MAGQSHPRATSRCPKSRRVGVAGRLEYREWKSADNVHHSIYEVVAAQVDFLDAPPTNGEPTYGDDEEPF